MNSGISTDAPKVSNQPAIQHVRPEKLQDKSKKSDDDCNNEGKTIKL